MILLDLFNLYIFIFSKSEIDEKVNELKLGRDDDDSDVSDDADCDTLQKSWTQAPYSKAALNKIKDRVGGQCRAYILLFLNCTYLLVERTEQYHHHHHQLNVQFLPKLIKGMDGCFPTA